MFKIGWARQSPMIKFSTVKTKKKFASVASIKKKKTKTGYILRHNGLLIVLEGRMVDRNH